MNQRVIREYNRIDMQLVFTAFNEKNIEKKKRLQQATKRIKSIKKYVK